MSATSMTYASATLFTDSLRFWVALTLLHVFLSVSQSLKPPRHGLRVSATKETTNRHHAGCFPPEHQPHLPVTQELHHRPDRGPDTAPNSNPNPDPLQSLPPLPSSLPQSQRLRPLPLFSSAFSSSKSSVEAPSASRFGFVGWYLGTIQCRPILTKSVTAALIYTAADLSSQTLAKSSFSESYDLVRTARMAGYGMLVLGPSLHFWFNFMSKVLPKRDMFSTLKKMAMGQLLYGPTMTFVFFSLNACLQGENGEEIVARLERDLFPTLLNGVMYWPICDFITFRFIPVHLQPLVSNGFSYLWTIYMTYMAGLEKAD